MWKLWGVIIGCGIGIGAATYVGDCLGTGHSPLGPLDMAIIGAVVAVSKDATIVLLDLGQIHWEYWRLRRRLRGVRRDLSAPGNERTIPHDEIKLAIDRLLARGPHRVDRLAALTQLTRALQDCLTRLGARAGEARFCDLSPSMRATLREILDKLNI